jgi:hypothetical protein
LSSAEIPFVHSWFQDISSSDFLVQLILNRP